MKNKIKTLLLSSLLVISFNAQAEAVENNHMNNKQQLLYNTLLNSLISSAGNTPVTTVEQRANNKMNRIMQTILLEKFVNSYSKSVNKDFNIINLNLEEKQSVIEDYLEVNLKVYEEGDDSVEVQKKLLLKYNSASEKIKTTLNEHNKDIENNNSIEVKNTYFRVYPQEQYNKVSGALEKTIWKGEAYIILGGTDIEKISQIATNNELIISSSQMKVSEALRDKTMRDLQSKIIHSFKQRAALLSKDLGFNGDFTIKELNVNYQNSSSMQHSARLAMSATPEFEMRSDMQNEPISTIPSEVNISAYINGSVILGKLSEQTDSQ